VFLLTKSICIKGLMSPKGLRAKLVPMLGTVPVDTWGGGSLALFNSSDNIGDIELVNLDLLFTEEAAWGEPQAWDSSQPLWYRGPNAPPGQTNKDLHGYTDDGAAVPLVRRPTPDGKMLKCEKTTIGLQYNGNGNLTLTDVNISNFTHPVKSTAVLASVSFDGCDISGKHVGILTTSHKFKATNCNFHDVGVGIGYEETDYYSWGLDHALYIEPNVDITLTSCHFFNTRKRIQTHTFANDRDPKDPTKPALEWSGYGDMLRPGGVGPAKQGIYRGAYPNTVVSLVGCTFMVVRAASTHPDGLTTMTDCTFFSGTNWGVNIAAQGRVVLTRCHFFNDIKFNLGLEGDQVLPPGGDKVTSNNTAIFIVSSTISGKAETRWASLTADTCDFHGYKAAVKMQDPGNRVGGPSSPPFNLNPVVVDFAFHNCYFGIPWLQGEAAQFGPAAAFDTIGGPCVLRLGDNVYRNSMRNGMLENPAVDKVLTAGPYQLRKLPRPLYNPVDLTIYLDGDVDRIKYKQILFRDPVLIKQFKQIVQPP
jgi:hypothetical protein